MNLPLCKRHSAALLAMLMIGLPAIAAAQSATSTSTPDSTRVAKAETRTRVMPPLKQQPSAGTPIADDTSTAGSLSMDQIAAAERVFTGAAACEFNQSVDIQRVTDKPGYFHVSYKGQTYLMAPETTTTGAVRLVDQRKGVVWIQIPTKSMMLNHKVGRRMVDSCLHAEQRQAMAVAATSQ